MGFRRSPAAGVAEPVDALDLGSSDASRGGSSPSARTSAGQSFGVVRQGGRFGLDLNARHCCINIQSSRC